MFVFQKNINKIKIRVGEVSELWLIWQSEPVISELIEVQS